MYKGVIILKLRNFRDQKLYTVLYKGGRLCLSFFFPSGKTALSTVSPATQKTSSHQFQS